MREVPKTFDELFRNGDEQNIDNLLALVRPAIDTNILPNFFDSLTLDMVQQLADEHNNKLLIFLIQFCYKFSEQERHKITLDLLLNINDFYAREFLAIQIPARNIQDLKLEDVLVMNDSIKYELIHKLVEEERRKISLEHLIPVVNSIPPDYPALNDLIEAIPDYKPLVNSITSSKNPINIRVAEAILSLHYYIRLKKPISSSPIKQRNFQDAIETLVNYSNSTVPIRDVTISRQQSL